MACVGALAMTWPVAWVVSNEECEHIWHSVVRG